MMPPSNPLPKSRLPNKSAPVEISRSSKDRASRHVARFDADLWRMAEQYMGRRRSRTLDSTDIDSSHAWLTRLPPKAVVRDAIASVMIFMAAGMMAYGINLLSATPSATRGGWFVVAVSVAFGLFAETFRRWDYD